MTDPPWGMPPFDTFDELIAWIRARRSEGRSREEVKAFLCGFLRGADEELDDMIRDALDCLCGRNKQAKNKID